MLWILLVEMGLPLHIAIIISGYFSIVNALNCGISSCPDVGVEPRGRCRRHSENHGSPYFTLSRICEGKILTFRQVDNILFHRQQHYDNLEYLVRCSLLWKNGEHTTTDLAIVNMKVNTVREAIEILNKRHLFHAMLK